MCRQSAKNQNIYISTNAIDSLAMHQEPEQPQEQPRPSRGERRASARAKGRALSAMLHDDAELPMAKKPKKAKKPTKASKSEEAQPNDGVHVLISEHGLSQSAQELLQKNLPSVTHLGQGERVVAQRQKVSDGTRLI